MVRFKYTLTCFIEDHGYFFAVTSSILFCLLSDFINPFDGVNKFFYYSINIFSTWVGWYVGAFISIVITNWMRARTIWINEWKAMYPEDTKDK